MRFVLLFCLLIIIANFQRTTTNDYCRCECCTSNGCNPTLVDTHPLESCSASFNCRPIDCFQWHTTKCPPISSPGQTRPFCISNSERLLPTLFLIIGMNLIIRVIKDKF